MDNSVSVPRAEFGAERSRSGVHRPRDDSAAWDWEPVDDVDIDDLKARVTRYRGPVLSRATGWSRGVPADYLGALMEHWASSFDWRVPEARIRSYPWTRFHINGEPATAIHQRSGSPDAPVVVLLHGWPDSFLRFERVLPLLSDFQRRRSLSDGLSRRGDCGRTTSHADLDGTTGGRCARSTGLFAIRGLGW